MRKHVIVSWIFAVMLGCKVFGQTADDYVSNGTNDLANQDLLGAHTNFQAALALEPTNETANVLLALTRVLLVPQTPAGTNFLNGLNFPIGGRDIFNWTSAPPKDAQGGPIFLPNYNSTNIVFFFRTNIMPVIAMSLTNLANLTDTNFLLTLDLGQFGLVTIDYGDVQMFRAGLTAADFLGYTLDANNSSFILPQIVSIADTNGLTLQRILSTYPSLLTPHNTNDLIPSEIAFSNAATFYFTASDFIRNDRSSDDTSDLITLDPSDANSEANFRSGLSNVLMAMTAPTQLAPNDPDSIIWLGPYFSGTNSVRKLAPQFNNNSYVNDSLPDYTFAGMLPDEPKYKTEAFLRKTFASRAGFYVGNVQDNSVGDPNAGIFEVFLGANNQIDIVGYDSDSAGTASGGFLVQATVDANGDWQVSNSSVNASGHVGQHGGFDAELDFSNGDSMQLYNSMEILPPGPFEGAAGYYTGSASASGHTASLAGILAPDGEFLFREVDSSGTSAGGGYAPFDPTNDTFSTLAFPDTTVSGTLNPSTFKITGNFSSPGGGSGTFSMSRSANLNLDVPPAISSDLPANVTLPLGNTLELTLGASGSAPLSFQWYLQSTEDPPIPGATSSTLVISNNFLQHTGQYQVWATVNNAIGGTNSQVTTVTVTTETNVPTVTITSPKPGQLWSNADFTITGTTSDKAGINNVFYYINNGLFTEATTSDNWARWSAGITLTPGTNTINAIAYNVGGIAATNSVKMVYVESGVLTVITNGMGSITPNDNGALLQIGKVFSLTATGTHGFKFVNWTGGTNQPFSVYTNGPTVQFVMSNNLTMQANFTDTNKPFVSITNATSGMLWSNAAFTVMGRATDNLAVASVNYSLNGSGYALATTNGSSWSAGVILVPGTNTFSVYATDTTGNISATNTVKIVYILSAMLTVQTNGMGIITPNDNGALLQIGKIYSLTATGKNGFAFTNWTGSTNGTFTVLTNKSTVTFTMFSNLVLVANLVDTNKPFINFTNVTSGMQVSNAAFTVMGRATDDVAVASVNYSLNSAAYTEAESGGGSWNAGVTLIPGTNTFSVYAADTTGNISATNTIKIVYVLSATLTVQTNGMGIITPNDNGALLQIGKIYSLTATGKNGFAFTNWTGSTNGTFTVLTNKSTLTFTMFSNLVLVANLVDTNKPFINITNITSGMQVSNAAFTVMGRTTDNVAVASVDYKLNGGDYVPTETGGGSWNAGVTLIPGTNTFSVFATDTSGNISATNTIKIVYIVSAMLTVQTNGVGSISPDDNGAMLQLGKIYSLTATARDGFMFTNWTGSTNGTFTVLTNKSTITFTMFSNLVLVANLVDTNKPFLSITNVTSGKQMTNMEFTVMGRATDNVAVASVNFSLDGDPYSPASTSDNWAHWSAALAMTPGTNKFSVYAVDSNGNTSATNTITVIRIPTMTTFLIATNEGITQPFARIAFDGTNYLVVFVGTNGVLGQFVSQTGARLGGPITLAPGISEDQPNVEFDGTNYLVAWKGNPDQAGNAPAIGVFVSPAGEVSDPIQLSQSTTLFNLGTVAFGGGVYFLMWSDNITSPTSVYGAIVDGSGTNVSGDFLISSDASADETAQNAAAFDGTNFLAVWYPGNANDNLAIKGQLIDTNGALVGSPFLIYTNSVPTGTAPPQVLFDGTKFLVLFDIGINSATASAYHVIGRFVTTSGGVLTNQVNLTADTGPQIAGSSDFDGFNYLMAWNQGLNFTAISTTSTINGRFFDSGGAPVSVEFPIFKTQGSQVPTWSPVLFDGTRFVIAAGLGKEISPLAFTNGVIYGAFISP